MTRPILQFRSQRPPGDDNGDGSGSPRSPRQIARSRPRHRQHKWHANSKIYDLTAMVAEFIGTFLFLWLSFEGAQSASYNRGTTGDQAIKANDNQTIMYIALSFGISLIVVAWGFFRITGAAFNPAVTFALWLVGNQTAFRASLIGIAQFLGGIAAAGMTKVLTLPQGVSLVNRTTAGITNGMALTTEMFTTATLVFTVLIMAAEKHRGTFLAPVCIGLALFAGHLASLGWTGAGINPARTLGSSVVSHNFPHNAWVYYVGQFLGAFLATLVYTLLKHLDYEQVVPDVDTEDHEASQAIEHGPIGSIMTLVLPAPRGSAEPNSVSEIPDHDRSVVANENGDGNGNDKTLTRVGHDGYPGGSPV